ncbi:MAG: cupredoxin family protein [Proteobacteria bacterium]|nr:cupredoxin family protein [Pseudomonadota bacterium]
MLVSGAALAHGDKHAEPAKADYSKAEQMPFGVAVDPKKAVRTIRVEMADTMRFTPGEVKVKQGDTVRFIVTNNGKVMHEMVLGTMDDLKKHSEIMRKNPGMEHDELYMAHVAPAKTAEMGWRFSKAGTFYYGCLIPGHFEAGMIGKVIVE